MQAYLTEEFAYLLKRLQSFALGESGRTSLDETVAVLGTQNGNTPTRPTSPRKTTTGATPR